MILWYAPELQHLTSIVILEKMAALWGYKAFWSRQLHTGGVKEYIVSRVDFSFQFLQFSKICGEESILTQRSWVNCKVSVASRKKNYSCFRPISSSHNIFRQKHYVFFKDANYLFILFTYLFFSLYNHSQS